jgi:hypothetical protein
MGSAWGAGRFALVAFVVRYSVLRRFDKLEAWAIGRMTVW